MIVSDWQILVGDKVVDGTEIMVSYVLYLRGIIRKSNQKQSVQ